MYYILCSHFKKWNFLIQAVVWGKAHEKDAIMYFENHTGWKVTDVGIYISQSGYLEASPDGMINDNIIEVKCPWKYRDKSFMSAINDSTFYLNMENDLCSLKTDHVYYHQVMGNLYLTKTRICFFIVWTPNWSVTVPVENNIGWNENIVKLENLYESVFISKIIEHKTSM